MITQERLKELLHYDPETGLFTWLVSRRGHAKAGDVAGCTNVYGYTVIRVDGVLYQAHRLAWLYVHGVWPVDELDHENGIKNDNRIKNLREATGQQNSENLRLPHRDNTSGYLGVYKSGRKWASRISVDGRRRYLGDFHDPAEAHEAYLQAKRRMHEFCTI